MWTGSPDADHVPNRGGNNNSASDTGGVVGSRSGDCFLHTTTASCKCTPTPSQDARLEWAVCLCLQACVTSQAVMGACVAGPGSARSHTAENERGRHRGGACGCVGAFKRELRAWATLAFRFLLTCCVGDCGKRASRQSGKA